MSKSKRFVQVGDTSIKDTLTGEKYYAPCEDDLLDLLNELSEKNEQLKQEVVVYKKAFQQQVQRCTL